MEGWSEVDMEKMAKGWMWGDEVKKRRGKGRGGGKHGKEREDDYFQILLGRLILHKEKTDTIIENFRNHICSR